MATRYSDALPDGLRYEPTDKWIRAERDGNLVVDTTEALLVWRPGQVVPQHALPESDVDAALREEAERFDDPDLRGYVAVPWSAVERWLEEDEEMFGHPRDPFHRVDIRQSSRHVVIEVDGHPVAESRAPTLLFETGLPVRHYLPLDDVAREVLRPSDFHTQCAYKGQASYYSVETASGLHENLAWTYPEPLRGAGQIKGLVAFFDERVDTTVDGRIRARPRTQWS